MTYEVASSAAPAADQDGVLTTSQACLLFGRPRVRAQLAAKRWRRPTRGVVVLHNGPLTPVQEHWVALLSCPPGSVLGGITALGYDGFTGMSSHLPEVVLPEGRRMLSDISLVRTGRLRSVLPTSIRCGSRLGPGPHAACSMRRVGLRSTPSGEPARSYSPAYNNDSSALVISAKP